MKTSGRYVTASMKRRARGICISWLATEDTEISDTTIRRVYRVLLRNNTYLLAPDGNVGMTGASLGLPRPHLIFLIAVLPHV